MNNEFLEAVRIEFAKHKGLAEGAVQQLSPRAHFFERPAPESNSIAIIMKHVGGNLVSRWTDFLTTDGEKGTRDRDSEFVVNPGDGEVKILEVWERGWDALSTTLESLTASDLDKLVAIRGESHSVYLALMRSLAHTAYHVGQITYLCRMLVTGEWRWLTIPPGGSAEFNRRKSGPI